MCRNGATPDLDTSVAAYHDSEVAGVQIGTTFTDEYRPADVQTPPGPQPDLLADYADGYPVDRAHAPDGVDVFAVASGPTSNDWQTRADEAFTMEVYTFNWPGWVAAVDGGQVAVTSSPNHGFITFEVPAGQHDVSVLPDGHGAAPFGQPHQHPVDHRFLCLYALLACGCSRPGYPADERASTGGAAARWLDCPGAHPAVPAGAECLLVEHHARSCPGWQRSALYVHGRYRRW